MMMKSTIIMARRAIWHTVCTVPNQSIIDTKHIYKTIGNTRVPNVTDDR